MTALIVIFILMVIVAAILKIDIVMEQEADDWKKIKEIMMIRKNLP